MHQMSLSCIAWVWDKDSTPWFSKHMLHQEPINMAEVRGGLLELTVSLNAIYILA